MTEDELDHTLSQICFVGLVALDELLGGGGNGDGAGSRRSATRSRTARNDPVEAFEVDEMKHLLADAINRMPRPRAPRAHALLLRGPDARRDRPGPRRHREPRLPDPHQGDPPAALAARRTRAGLTRLTIRFEASRAGSVQRRTRALRSSSTSSSLPRAVPRPGEGRVRPRSPRVATRARLRVVALVLLRRRAPRPTRADAPDARRPAPTGPARSRAGSCGRSSPPRSVRAPVTAASTSPRAPGTPRARRRRRRRSCSPATVAGTPRTSSSRTTAASAPRTRSCSTSRSAPGSRSERGDVVGHAGGIGRRSRRRRPALRGPRRRPLRRPDGAVPPARSHRAGAARPRRRRPARPWVSPARERAGLDARCSRRGAADRAAAGRCAGGSPTTGEQSGDDGGDSGCGDGIPLIGDAVSAGCDAVDWAAAATVAALDEASSILRDAGRLGLALASKLDAPLHALVRTVASSTRPATPSCARRSATCSRTSSRSASGSGRGRGTCCSKDAPRPTERVVTATCSWPSAASTATRLPTAGTFDLDTHTLGYPTTDVTWFSYASAGGKYSKDDTHGDLREKAKLLGAAARGHGPQHPGSRSTSSRTRRAVSSSTGSSPTSTRTTPVATRRSTRS